jgi:hypothetical protein
LAHFGWTYIQAAFGLLKYENCPMSEKKDIARSDIISTEVVLQVWSGEIDDSAPGESPYWVDL